jgi:hypothetical protein
MRIPLAVSFLIILLSCKTSQVNIDKSLMIYFEKTACYGKCPQYKLSIAGDGKCSLLGIKNTNNIGSFEKQLSPEETKALFADFEKIQFDTLKEKYLSQATDLPFTIYKLTKNNQTRSVTSQQGKPECLDELNAKLSSIAIDENWIKKD